MSVSHKTARADPFVRGFANSPWIPNIILGVIGAGLASWLFGLLGVGLPGPGWLGYLIAGFVGACILILATRMIPPARWRG